MNSHLAFNFRFSYCFKFPSNGKSSLYFVWGMLLWIVVFQYDAHAQFPHPFRISNLNGENGMIIAGTHEYGLENNSLGLTVTFLGDINGDHLDDVGIGDPSYIYSGEGFPLNINSVGRGFGLLGNQAQDSLVNVRNNLNPYVLDFKYITTEFYIKDECRYYDHWCVDPGDSKLQEYFHSLSKEMDNIGDFNGDGIDDYILSNSQASFAYGRYNNDPLLYDRLGESYVILGRKDTLSNNISVLGRSRLTIRGEDEGDLAGTGASGAGDINGDGLTDLLIGVPGSDPNGKSDAGEVYVIYGQRDYSVLNNFLSLSEFDSSMGFKISGLDINNKLGSFNSEIGDINGDGLDDFIITSVTASRSGYNNVGEAYVIFGSRDGFPFSFDLNSLNGTNGFIIPNIPSDNYRGFEVNHAGDINGDGLDDLIIGAFSASSDNKLNTGISYIVFGSKDEFSGIFGLETLDGTNGFSIHGIGQGDRSGYSVHSAGDINQDGLSDIIIGAPYSFGEVYVVYGSKDWISPQFYLKDLHGDNGFTIKDFEAYSRFGISVSGGGDFNGDGIDDIIIGAHEASITLTQNNREGKAYIIYGRKKDSINTKSFNAIEDAFTENADSKKETNYGQENQLLVWSDPNGHKFATYIKFNLPQVDSFLKAEIKLYGKRSATSHDPFPDTTICINIFGVDTEWSEDSIHFNNAPEPVGNPLDIQCVSSEEDYYHWDVTDYVKVAISEGLSSVGFVLFSTDTLDYGEVSFHSTEQGRNPPRIAISVEQDPVDIDPCIPILADTALRYFTACDPSKVRQDTIKYISRLGCDSIGISIFEPDSIPPRILGPRNDTTFIIGLEQDSIRPFWHPGAFLNPSDPSNYFLSIFEDCALDRYTRPIGPPLNSYLTPGIYPLKFKAFDKFNNVDSISFRIIVKKDFCEYVNISPSGDTYDNNANSLVKENFGNARKMFVRHKPNGYGNISYVSFELSSLDSVSNASLQLTGFNPENNNKVGVAIYATDTSWNESILTFQNAPSALGEKLDEVVIDSKNIKTYSWDVSTFINTALKLGQKTVAFTLVSTNSNSERAQFYTKEHTNTDYRPTLSLCPLLEQVPCKAHSDSVVNLITVCDSSQVRRDTVHRFNQFGCDSIAINIYALDTIPPVLRCPPNDTTIYIKEGTILTYKDFHISAYDYCTANPIIEQLSSPITGPGHFIVSFKATDEHSNEDSCSFSINAVLDTCQYQSIKPSDDSYINNGETELDANYNHKKRVLIRDRSGTFDYTAFIKFDVEGILQVNNALLNMYGQLEKDNDPNMGISVVATYTNWDEETLTFNNAPDSIGQILDSVKVSYQKDASSTGPERYSWDVTSYINERLNEGATSVSFSLFPSVPRNNDVYSYFLSKEADQNGPELVFCPISPPDSIPIPEYDTTFQIFIACTPSDIRQDTLSLTNRLGLDSVAIHIFIPDQTPPLITCPLKDITTIISKGEPYAFVDFDVSAVDNCSSEVVIEQLSGFNKDQGFPPGINTVSFVAKDAFDNADTCSFNIVVVVDTCSYENRPAMADASVNNASSQIDTNIGQSKKLTVRDKPNGWGYTSFVTFDLSDVSSVSQGIVSLYGRTEKDYRRSVKVSIFPADADWEEDSITFASAPNIREEELDHVYVDYSLSDPQLYSWDVTSYINQVLANGNTKVSFALKAIELIDNYDKVLFSSREDTELAPNLFLCVGEVPEPLSSTEIHTVCKPEEERRDTLFLFNRNGLDSLAIHIYQLDNTPPVLSCPLGDVIVYTEGGEDTVIPNIKITATDFCPEGLILKPISGPRLDSALSVGTYPVAFEATDAQGYSTTCEFNIIVQRDSCYAINIHPPHDTEVNSSSSQRDTNYGRNGKMFAKNNLSGNPNRISFLKFDLPKLTSDVSAILNVYGRRPENDGLTVRVAVFPADTNWHEDSVTFNNAPAIKNIELDAIDIEYKELTTILYQHQFDLYSWDVSSYIDSLLSAGVKRVAFALMSTSPHNGRVQFITDEFSQLYAKPYLSICPKENEADPTPPAPDTIKICEDINFPLTADALISNTATDLDTNFGQKTYLFARNKSSYGNVSYLQFDISSLGTTEKVILKLYGANTKDEQGIEVGIFGTGDEWSEDGITWSNAPSYSLTPLATDSVIGTTPQTYEWDVTEYVRNQTDGMASFVVASLNEGSPYRRAKFNSKESGNNIPQMVMTVCRDSISTTNSFADLGFVEPIVPHNRSLRLFPNPTDSKTQLVIDNEFEGRILIELWNVTGQKMQEITMEKAKATLSHSLDLAQLSSGIYLIRVQSGDIFQQKRLQISK